MTPSAANALAIGIRTRSSSAGHSTRASTLRTQDDALRWRVRRRASNRWCTAASAPAAGTPRIRARRVVATTHRHCDLRGAEVHGRSRNLPVDERAVGDQLHATLARACQPHHLLPGGAGQRFAKGREGQRRATPAVSRESRDEAFESCQRHMTGRFLPSVLHVHRAVERDAPR